MANGEPVDPKRQQAAKAALPARSPLEPGQPEPRLAPVRAEAVAAWAEPVAAAQAELTTAVRKQRCAR